jgi:serine protease AprX
VRRIGVFLVLALLCAFAPATAHAGVHADRDRDKLFDDLETRLSDSERLPILVALNDDASAARVERITGAVGDLGHVTRLRIVDAFAATATPSQIRALARRTDVAHVEEDAKVVEFGVSAQSAFGVTRAREDIPGLDGSGMVAAVLDSGIDTTIPDLPPSKVIGWKDMVYGRESPYDDTSHGTLVSSVLAGSGAGGAEGRGVAPAASLVGVKVVDNIGMSSLSLIAQGVQWVVENRATYGIDAMNLSIGDPVGCGSGTDVASEAVDAAVAAGIVVVIAAGNHGPANCTVKSPGAAESALTVGAMADTGAGGFSQAFFSSRGPTADGRIKPDVSAAGVNVPMAKPGGGYVASSGTSVATPFTTGTALLMLQANPALTPAQVKQTVMDTAIDWGRPGKDVEYGAGRLDAYAALRAAGAPLAVPPAAPEHRVWSGTLAQGEVATSDVEIADPRFPLAVTMLGPSTGFDLSLRDANGTSVGTMTTQWGPSRQEDITLTAPAPGHYTVRVEASADAGEFVTDISGALAPADSAAPGLTLAELPAATNDDTPGLHGDAETGLGDFPAVVARVLRNGQPVRRLAATPLLGQWSVTVSPPLEPGEYTVEVEQGDSAGNVTRRSHTFTVDTSAPSTPVVAPVTSPQRSRTVSLSGTAEPGAKVSISEGADKLAHVTAAPDSAWAHAAQQVADGAHTYDVTATDAAGNVSAASSVTVTVDTVAPTATLTSAPSGATKLARPTFAFASEAGARFECRIGGAYEDCTSPHTPAALADGAHRFFVRAIDAAGNVGAVVGSAEFTVDTAAPAAPEIVASVSGGDASFQVSGEAGSVLECSVDASAWTACAPAYSGFAPGPHVFESRAIDAAGNVGPVARHDWTVAAPTPPPALNADRTPPAIADPPPVISLTVRRQRLGTVVRGGLSVRVGCSCRATLVLTHRRRVAARRTLSVSETVRTTLKLSAATRRTLARAKRVTLTLSVSAPGAETITRKVTVKR